MKHDSGCPVRSHSDAARRASDAVNLHYAALGTEAIGKWVAIRLADGSSDGTLYDRKRDAVRHQPDEKLAAYVCIHVGGLNICAAESFMKTSRMAYDAGFRLADPDAKHGGLDLIPRLTQEDQGRQFAALGRKARR
jgi:hypothetical protein